MAYRRPKADFYALIIAVTGGDSALPNRSVSVDSGGQVESLLKVTEPQTTTICGSFVYSAQPASINNQAADSPATAFCFKQNFQTTRTY